MIVDVWVRVCSATDVTIAGEEVVEVEIDEVVDKVAGEVADDEVADDEVADEVVTVDEIVKIDVLVLFKMEKLAVISK